MGSISARGLSNAQGSVQRSPGLVDFAIAQERILFLTRPTGK